MAPDDSPPRAGRLEIMTRMPVLAHAKKDQIQNRLAIFARQRNLAQFRPRALNGGGRRIFTVDAMDLGVGDFQRPEQELVGQFEVAFGIIRWNTTLVGPVKMHVAGKGRCAAVPRFFGLLPGRQPPQRASA